VHGIRRILSTMMYRPPSSKRGFAVCILYILSCTPFTRGYFSETHSVTWYVLYGRLLTILRNSLCD